MNTKVSVWTSNRNALFRAIYDGLPAAEQKRMDNKIRDELERRQALDPDHICNYFGGQRGALEASLLANAMEPEYGSKIDRRAEYRKRIVDSVDSSLRALDTDYLHLLRLRSNPTES